MTSLHSVTPLSLNLLMRLNCAIFILTCLLVTQCHSNCAPPADPFCQDCSSPPPCTLCTPGYYIDSSDQKCKPCDAKHPPACSTCTETECTLCPFIGYYPRNPTCNSTIYARPFSVRSMFFKLLQCVHFTRELSLLLTLNHSEPRRKWQRVHSGLFWYSELRELRPRRQQQMPDMQAFICH
jgi:hypothetical protein